LNRLRALDQLAQDKSLLFSASPEEHLLNGLRACHFCEFSNGSIDSIADEPCMDNDSNLESFWRGPLHSRFWAGNNRICPHCHDLVFTPSFLYNKADHSVCII
jgi:hypothetical protein